MQAFAKKIKIFKLFFHLLSSSAIVIAIGLSLSLFLSALFYFLYKTIFSSSSLPLFSILFISMKIEEEEEWKIIAVQNAVSNILYAFWNVKLLFIDTNIYIKIVYKIKWEKILCHIIFH
jgi:hypothetical protein